VNGLGTRLSGKFTSINQLIEVVAPRENAVLPKVVVDSSSGLAHAFGCGVVSSLAANSNSSNTVRMIPGAMPLIRTRSSIETGLGPRRRRARLAWLRASA
jgi:hypothetical protein